MSRRRVDVKHLGKEDGNKGLKEQVTPVQPTQNAGGEASQLGERNGGSVRCNRRQIQINRYSKRSPITQTLESLENTLNNDSFPLPRTFFSETSTGLNLSYFLQTLIKQAFTAKPSLVILSKLPTPSHIHTQTCTLYLLLQLSCFFWVCWVVLFFLALVQIYIYFLRFH